MPVKAIRASTKSEPWLPINLKKYNHQRTDFSVDGVCVPLFYSWDIIPAAVQGYQQRLTHYPRSTRDSNGELCYTVRFKYLDEENSEMVVSSPGSLSMMYIGNRTSRLFCVDIKIEPIRQAIFDQMSPGEVTITDTRMNNRLEEVFFSELVILKKRQIGSMIKSYDVVAKVVKDNIAAIFQSKL